MAETDPLTQTQGLLHKLYERRSQLSADLEAALSGAQREGRKELTFQETRSMDDIRELNKRISEQEEEVRRAGDDNPTLSRIRSKAVTGSIEVREKAQYHKHAPYSYLQDLMKTSLNMDTDGEARRRLLNHSQDVAERPEYRDLDRNDATDPAKGGYAVPPAWMMDQFIELARPGRAFANLVQNQPLPGGTDSINIPKIASGTTTGVQYPDNSAVAGIDLQDTFINAPVRTIAGQQGVAIQLLDQSPIAFDDVIFRDLAADYSSRVDKQVIEADGSGGNVKGVLATPGIDTIAVRGTGAGSAVVVGDVYRSIADAVQRIHSKRFQPPEVVVMHPRRWGWLLASLDNSDRPLFLPAANNGMNVQGVLTAVASQQVVGQMHGLPVVTDPNVPTTLGAAPNNDEDIIIVTRASDLILWESGIRARVLPEIKADTLTVLLQIYGYLAFTAERYPQSTAVIAGLRQPVF